MLTVILFLLGWYIIGAVVSWHTMVTIDPIYTRRDLVMNILMGLVGPVALFWWAVYAAPELCGGASKPIKWLSKRNK